MYFLIILLSLFATNIYSAEKIAVLFGANGSNVGFNNEFNTLTKALVKKEWGVQIAAGKSVNVESIEGDESKKGIKNNGKFTPVDSASPGSKAGLLSELKKAIDKLGPDDELFLGILTHGMPKGELGARAHMIKINNGKDEDKNSWMEVNDPDFLKLLKTAKSKGIKIGISDFSCYGGGSVEVLSPYACVVSRGAADVPVMIRNPDFYEENENKTSLKTLVGGFSKGVEEGLDMGEIFLKLLFDNDRSNTPHISGLSMEAYPVYEGAFAKPHMKMMYSELVCKINNQFDELISLEGMDEISKELYLQEANNKLGAHYANYQTIAGMLKSQLAKSLEQQKRLEQIVPAVNIIEKSLLKVEYEFNFQLPEKFTSICKELEQPVESSKTFLTCTDVKNGKLKFKSNALESPADYGATQFARALGRAGLWGEEKEKISKEMGAAQRASWDQNKSGLNELSLKRSQLHSEYMSIQQKIDETEYASKNAMQVLRGALYMKERAMKANASKKDDLVKRCSEFKF